MQAQDLAFFSEAHITFSGEATLGGKCLAVDGPLDGIRLSGIYQFPDVFGKRGALLLAAIFQGLFVVVEPFLECVASVANIALGYVA